MKVKTLSVGLAFLLWAPACATTSQVEALQRSVDELKQAQTSGNCVTREEMAQLLEVQKDILVAVQKVKSKVEDGAPERPQRPRGPDAEAVYAVPAKGHATKGGNNAWVTIVEFSDFQCPYCRRVNGTLEQIQKHYGDDVRVVFRHNALSFHMRARPSAIAAECARDQGKFWPMHDLLFENQRALEDSDLMDYARRSGLSMGDFEGCFKNAKPGDKIDSDQRNAASFGARGTPAFFINGRFLSGAQPFERFKALIDETMAQAKKSGVPASEYYEKIVIGQGQKEL